MFEREIKFIYDFNLNKVNKLGPYFTFEQLAFADLHPAILHYISAEIDYIIFEDRQKLLKNSVFDYSGERITNYFTLISEEVKRTKRFSLEYISKLILHASSFTINYLVRPKWTLLKFVYDEGDHKTTSEIKQILNYVYYYNYLKKILISYINSKKILSMNSEEFSDLLNKVDKLGVETYLPSIFSSALKSISEFFNIGELQKTKIPLLAIELFLEEKKLNQHLEKLHSAFSDDKNQKYNVADYRKVLDSVMVEKSEYISEQEQRIDKEVIEEPIEAIKETVTEKQPEDNEPDVTNQENETGLVSPKTPAKLRIRIDKNNEIEPVIEEIHAKDKWKKQIIEEVHTEDKKIEPVIDEVHAKDKWKEQITEEVHTEDKKIEPIIEEVHAKDKWKEQITEEVQTEDKKIEPRVEEVESENIVVESIKEIEDDYGIDGLKFEDENIVFENVTDEDILPEQKEKIELEEKFSISINDILKDKLPEKIQESELEEVNDKVKSESESKELPTVEKFAETNINIGKPLFDELEESDLFGVPEEEDESMLKSILEKKEEFGDDEIELENMTLAYKEENAPLIDIAELLEHKDMTKVIEVIFDYDIEDFAGTLNAISECVTLDEAYAVLNETFRNHHVDKDSKEAETFRTIISHYFNRK